MQVPPAPHSPPPGVGSNPDKAAELARAHSALVVVLHRLRDDATCGCITPEADGTLSLVAGQATAVAIIDAARAELGDPTKWHGRQDGYVEWTHFRTVLKQIGTLTRGNVLQLKQELVGAAPTEDATVFTVKQDGSPVSRGSLDLSQGMEAILSRAEAAVHAAQPLTCYICLSVVCEKHPDEELLPTGCACCREGSTGGRAHVSCLATAAQYDPERWLQCPTCKQDFTHEMKLRMAQERWKRVSGRHQTDEERLTALSNLANALQSTGNAAAALPLLQEVVAVDRLINGDDDPRTLSSISQLGTHLMQMARSPADGNIIVEACKLLEEAYAGLRRTIGVEHETTIVSMSNLSSAYNKMAMMGHVSAKARARVMREEVAEVMRRTQPAAPNTFNTISNLGTTICNIGDQPAGFAMQAEATASARRVLGENHPITQQVVMIGSHTQEDLKKATAPGTRALGTLVGLASKPELNGKQVCVTGFDMAKGRYHVRHHGANAQTGRPLGIKPSNIILKHGTAVIVEGLQAAPEWNGQRGIIGSFDSAKGRYHLLFRGRPKMIGVRVELCKLEFAFEEERKATRRARIEANVRAELTAREAPAPAREAPAPAPAPAPEPEPTEPREQWGDLTVAEQQAARTLGFDESQWGLELPEPPPIFLKSWTELTNAERDAATELGYDSNYWDSEGSSSEEDEEDEEDFSTTPSDGHHDRMRCLHPCCETQTLGGNILADGVFRKFSFYPDGGDAREKVERMNIGAAPPENTAEQHELVWARLQAGVYGQVQ